MPSMWTALSDRDYYGDDGQPEPEYGEGDAWNDLTPGEYSLFTRDPGFAPRCGDPDEVEYDGVWVLVAA